MQPEVCEISVIRHETAGWEPYTPRRRLVDVPRIETRGGENRIADYLAVNPMGKIPALADGSFRLWEQTEGDAQAADAAREELARWLPGIESPLAWLERLLARPAWRRAADLVFGS